MLPTKEDFRETIFQLHAARQKQKEKEYKAYVKGAVGRMRPRRREWKRKVYREEM